MQRVNKLSEMNKFDHYYFHGNISLDMSQQIL